MASDAQVRANRLNALKSTGPRTAAGKAAVAQNAVKHGLSARQAVIVGEDVGEFEFYRDRMLAELSPEGAMESMLAERVVGLAWRLRRAERLQNETFDALLAWDTTGPFAKLTQALSARQQGTRDGAEAERDLTCGRVVVRDFANSHVLDRLLMYERRLEHSLYKTMAELDRLRLSRDLDGALTDLEGEEAQPAPERAKQTQFDPSPSEAKSRTERDVCENRTVAPEPKQSQSKPISYGPESVAEGDPDGFQRASRAVYSSSSQAGCASAHSTGTSVGL